MRSLQWAVPLLVLAVLAAPGCRSKDAGTDQKGRVLVEVNGKPITMDDLYLATGGEHGGNVTQAMQDAVLEELVNQELLCQEGIRLGLDKDAKYQNAVKIMEARLRQYRRSEMARRVGNTRIASTVNITSSDVDRYVEQNADQLRTEYHLWVARFGNETDAKEARNRLASGAKFETVAVRGPMHQSGGRPSWDLGYLPLIRIPAEWHEVAAKLEKGEISQVVSGKASGYSILKLVDRRKNPKLDLQSMRAAVMNRLRDDEVRKAYDVHMKTLRSEATIQRFQERRE